jgi:hypothetical protein
MPNHLGLNNAGRPGTNFAEKFCYANYLVQFPFFFSELEELLPLLKRKYVQQ